MKRTIDTTWRIAARVRVDITQGLALGLLLATPALAADYPVFRQGMWDYSRTIETKGPGAKPTTVSAKRCIDPTADMKRQNEMLSKQGCTFTPITVKGNVYTFSADCRMQGLSVRSTSVISADSATAYTLQVSSTGSEGPSQEKLVARRVGDCKP